MSAKEYFQRDAERETFYRTFYQFADALMSHGQQQRRKSELLLRKLPV